MSAKKLLIGAVILAVAGGGIAANIYLREPEAPEIRVETVARRDLTATVSGSGKIRPYREVDISANVMGRVTRLEVDEGDEVARGDFLLQIDPVPYRSAVERAEAGLEGARTRLRQAEEQLQYARNTLDRQEGLYRRELLSEQAYEEAVQEVRRQEGNVEAQRQEVEQLRAQLDQVRHDLSKVAIDSPIDGIITSLNVEEGENVVTGTMNNPGTVILTIADLSAIEAEIEIDETDIVHVELGQEATVRIDAFPEREFDAEVTEVGKSPIGATGLQASADQAVNFKVIVRLREAVPAARPGLSCTADIVTATREDAVAVPIQALVLREVRLDAEGDVIRDADEGDADAGRSETDEGAAAGGEGTEAAAEEPGGEDAAASEEGEEPRTVEREGTFVVRDGRAVFVPTRIGIAGERHFEVLEGVEVGDRVVVGPFDVVRTLQDGEPVQVDEEAEDAEP